MAVLGDGGYAASCLGFLTRLHHRQPRNTVNRMPTAAAPTAIPAIAPVESPPCATGAGEEDADGELEAEAGSVDVVVVAAELDADALDADSRSDALWLIWNMGAHSVNSGASVLVATLAAPLLVVVAVMVMVTGKVACATPTMFTPEHTPVGATVLLSVRTLVRQVFPSLFPHWKPLRYVQPSAWLFSRHIMR